MAARALSSLFLIVVGTVLLGQAWRGHISGELRAGLRGFQPFRPSREDKPLAFYLYLLLYLGIGLGSAVWGVLVLFGAAAPPRWR
jgi:hypothetical protein